MSKLLEFLHFAISSILTKSVNRMENTIDNFSVVVYAVGETVRIDIRPIK